MNFPGIPIIHCLSEDKCKYIAHPGDVLVDDRPKYRHLWEDAGGVFVHYQNPEQAVAVVLDLFTR